MADIVCFDARLHVSRDGAAAAPGSGTADRVLVVVVQLFPEKKTIGLFTNTKSTTTINKQHNN
jgi:hypothetical protein